MSLAAVALRGCRRLPTVAAVRAPTRRSMGGGGGHQPISQSMEAELFQGHPKEPEGWETTVYITYAATVVILTCALGFAPDTSIKTWASAEARARLEMQAEGKIDKPVFGVHYNTPEALGLEGDWEKFWVKSTKPGEDDEEDDEEDEEEEEADDDDDE